MRVSNEHPKNSFRKTGFYDNSFPNWRYTGKYGLVKHNIPLGALPKPYGSRGKENQCFVILALPFYLLEQVAWSFKAFFDNITKLYHGEHSYRDDLMLLPYALVDFIPPLFTAIAAPVAALATLIYVFAMAWYYDLASIPDESCWLLLSVLASPLLVGAGALFCAWEMLSALLMTVKAVLETVFALLTIISIPVKSIVTDISSLFEDSTDLPEENVPEQSSQRGYGMFAG